MNNWNPLVCVPVEPTVVPSMLYVNPLKSIVIFEPLGICIPLPVVSDSSIIVSPSCAAATASANVAYFVLPISATYEATFASRAPAPTESTVLSVNVLIQAVLISPKTAAEEFVIVLLVTLTLVASWFVAL